MPTITKIAYRYTPKGEIHKSVYDIDSGLIQGLKPNDMHVHYVSDILNEDHMVDMEYQQITYSDLVANMLSHPDVLYSIAIGDLGFYDCVINSNDPDKVDLVFREGFGDDSPYMYVDKLAYPYNKDDWKNVGVVKTKCDCFCCAPYIYRVNYNKKRNLILINSSYYSATVEGELLYDFPDNLAPEYNNKIWRDDFVGDGFINVRNEIVKFMLVDDKVVLGG